MKRRSNTRRWRRAATSAAGAAAAAALALVGPRPAGGAPATATRPTNSTRPASSSQPATAAATLSADVEAALVDLAADDWRRRDRAVARLTAAGGDDPSADRGPSDPSAPGPARATTNPDVAAAAAARDAAAREAVVARVRRFLAETDRAEARDRARAVLRRLSADRPLDPTRVTLRLRGATPRAAFADLSAQGGLAVRARREGLWAEREFAPLTLDVAGVPFWDAAADLCARTGMRPMYDGGDNGEPPHVVLVPDVTGEMTGRRSTAGLVTVLVDSLVRTAPADAAGPGAPGGGPATSDAELRLSFFADPGWRVAEHPWTGAVTAVVDANGNALPAPRPLTLQPFLDGSPRWAMRGTVRDVPAGVRRLARLAGTVRVPLLELTPAATVANLSRVRNAVSRSGPHSLLVAGVDREDQRYRVRAVFTPGGGTDVPPPPADELADAAWVVDAAGRPLRRTGSDATEAGGQVFLELWYEAAAADAPPDRLVWRVPLGPRLVDASFDLTDVPIAEP